MLYPTRSKVTTNVTRFAMVTVQILLVFKGKYKAKNFSMHMIERRKEDHSDENAGKNIRNLQSNQV